MYRLFYHIIICFFVLAFLNSCDQGKSIPSLTETYNRKDKKPFGAYVAHEEIRQLFSDNSIMYKNASFEDTWKYYVSDRNSIYICIAKKLFLTYNDKEAILNFLEEGNDLFIAAAQIDPLLLKEVGCKVYRSDYIENVTEEFYNNLNNTSIEAVRPSVNKYSYFYLPFGSYFYDIYNTDVKILSNNQYGQPNCLVFFYGKGRLFLHCDPRAFSNYFLLKKDNYQSLKNLMGYTRPEPTNLYWDDYYYKGIKKEDDNKFSALNFLLKHRFLRIAFWMTLLLLLLYIFFQGKRRQRVIKTIKPNVNTSVAFTETIGRLYLQKKDNHNIAQKMITYFNEHVRNRYFLNTNTINTEFYTSLSRKSGVDRKRVESLYNSIQHIQNTTEVIDFHLLTLNKKIQYFFRNSI